MSEAILMTATVTLAPGLWATLKEDLACVFDRDPAARCAGAAAARGRLRAAAHLGQWPLVEAATARAVKRRDAVLAAAILGVESFAAWGGLIVLPVVNGKLGFVIALAVGSVVTALIVNALKHLAGDRNEKDQTDDDLAFDIQVG